MTIFRVLLVLVSLALACVESARKCPCPADIEWQRAEIDAGRSISALAWSYAAYNKGVACSVLDYDCCAASHYLSAIELKPDGIFPEAFQNLAHIIEKGCVDTDRGLQVNRDAKMSMHYHLLSKEHAPDAVFRIGALSNIINIETNEPGGKHKEKLLRMAEELSTSLSALPESETWPENGHFTLATLFNELGEREMAHHELLKLLSNHPNHAMALLHTGNYHFTKEEYITARRYYREAAQAMSSSGEAASEYINQVMAMNNEGQCFREADELSSAIDTFHKTLTVMRNMTQSKSNSEVEIVAEHAYHKGTEVFTATNLFAVKTIASFWNNYEHLEHFLEMSAIDIVAHPERYVTEGMGDAGLIDPYTFTLQRFASRAADLGNSRLSCSSVQRFEAASKTSTLSHFSVPSSAVNNKTGSRVLRVGYISQDWRYHPMGRLTMKLVTSHTSGRINASCISYGAIDGSSVRQYVQGRMESQFHDVRDLASDEDASAYITKLGLDIVIDLTAYTYRGRISIAALKPAPIVINYLGYPGTTGCSGFDYTLVDRLVAPADIAPSAFSEKLIYLPHIYQANYMPPHVLPCLFRDRRKCRVRALLSRIDNYHHPSGTRTEGGREEDSKQRRNTDFATADNWNHPGRFWMCSFNSNKKLEPMVWQTWMQLLQETPRALLVLLEMHVEAKAELLRNAAMYGVHSSRLVFIRQMPWFDHLYRLSACDLVLDTFTYGAHTTASDALWMWVPVLSLESAGSQRMPSRVAAAITQSLLLDDAVVPVVQSMKQYQRMSTRLSQEPRATYSLHDMIGKASLRQFTFSHEVMQMSVERAYQVAAEAKNAAANSPMHVIAGTGVTIEKNSKASSHLLKDQLVAELNACLNRKPSKATTSNSNNECTLHTIGALSGRLLVSYPYAESAQVLRDLVFTDGMDGTKNAEWEVQCDALLHQWLTYEDQNDPVTSEKASLWLQPCVLIAPQKVLEYWLTHQGIDTSVSTKCVKDKIIFDVLAPLFLQKGRRWRVDWGYHMPRDVGDQLQDLLPEVFHKNAAGWDINSHFQTIFSRNALDVVQHVRSQIAQVVNNHAVCLLETNGFSKTTSSQVRSSILMMTSAYDIDQENTRLMNLGLIMQREDSNVGYKIAARAAVQLHDTRREEYLKSPRPKLTSWAGKGLSVAIYCYEYGNAFWGRWGPSSMEEGGTGLGGSEEAVLYVAEELARRGHRVTIYADPSDQDLRRGLIHGVRWRRHTEYDSSPNWAGAADVFISWRYGISLDIGANARKRLLWLQDMIEAESLPPPNTSLDIGTVLVLGTFHYKNLVKNFEKLGYSTEKAQKIPVIVPNGIDMRYFSHMQGSNRAHHFVYGSSPVRGLEQVLRVWPRIRNTLISQVGVGLELGHTELPTPTLTVYYGFPTHVTEQLQKSMGVLQFATWKEEMELLLKQDGVVYIGSVGHAELARGYADAGFLLYPTNFPETGCITAQKAMAAGAIPITSRYTSSVLPHLTQGWDMGPQVPLQPGMNYAQWVNDHWVPAVLAAVNTSPDILHRHREAMKTTIREKYSWTRSTDILVSLFPEEEDG